MKHNLTKLAVGVALAIGASQANAAITVGNSGELFLAAWSPSLQTSYVRDLGISLANFNTTSTTVVQSGTYAFNPSAAPGPLVAGSVRDSSYNLNFGNDTLMLNSLGNGISLASDVVWMVGMIDDSGTGLNGRRFLSTVDGAMGNQLNGPLANFNASLGYIVGNNILGTHTSLNGSSISTPANPDVQSYFPNVPMQSWASNAAFDAAGELGESLSFYYLTPSSTNSASSAVRTKYATAQGVDMVWTLNADGSLSYAAVPIPAAAWLFGSGLLGLIGIARRRKTLAA